MTLNIVIGIPTVGRAPILRETLRALALQTGRRIAFSCAGRREGDVTGAADIGATEVLLAKPGLPAQRNALIAAAPDADIMFVLRR